MTRIKTDEYVTGESYRRKLSLLKIFKQFLNKKKFDMGYFSAREYLIVVWQGCSAALTYSHFWVSRILMWSSMREVHLMYIILNSGYGLCSKKILIKNLMSFRHNIKLFFKRNPHKDCQFYCMMIF